MIFLYRLFYFCIYVFKFVLNDGKTYYGILVNVNVSDKDFSTLNALSRLLLVVDNHQPIKTKDTDVDR